MLTHGVELGKQTWRAFLRRLGWADDQVDKVICHQVGSSHRETILKSLGIPESKDFSTFAYLGNMGTVSLPLTAALAEDRGFLRARRPRRLPGDRQRAQLHDAGRGMVNRRHGATTTMNPILRTLPDRPPRPRLRPRRAALHYIDEGSGEPVVMLHGNPTWSFYYRHLIDALRDSYRVIVPDHIGCGLSDKPDDSRYDYTLASRVDDLERLLDHLGLDRELTLVLHDWGGMIGMALRGAAPGADRAAGRQQHGGVPQARGEVVAAGAVDLPRLAAGRVAGPRAERLLPGDGLDRLQAAADAARAARRPTSHPMTPGAIGSPSSASSRTSPCGPATAATSWSRGSQDRLHLLESVPMLIVWGMKDFVFDHHFLDEWVRRFPDAEVHRFPGPATTSSRTKRTRSTAWCRRSSRPIPSSGSTSVESHRPPPSSDRTSPST